MLSADTDPYSLDADSTRELPALEKRIQEQLGKSEVAVTKKRQPAKSQYSRKDRVALARDISDYLSRQLLKRAERLEREWNALESETTEAETELATLRSMPKKKLDDCIRLAGLEKYVSELDQQRNQFQARLQKGDVGKRAAIKALAPFVAAMRVETVDVLREEIENALLPFCNHVYEATPLAVKTPAYIAADLKWRYSDWASNNSILPEAQAKTFISLLDEYVTRYGQSDQGE